MTTNTGGTLGIGLAVAERGIMSWRRQQQKRRERRNASERLHLWHALHLKRKITQSASLGVAEHVSTLFAVYGRFEFQKKISPRYAELYAGRATTKAARIDCTPFTPARQMRYPALSFFSSYFSQSRDTHVTHTCHYTCNNGYRNHHSEAVSPPPHHRLPSSTSQERQRAKRSQHVVPLARRPEQRSSSRRIALADRCRRRRQRYRRLTGNLWRRPHTIVGRRRCRARRHRPLTPGTACAPRISRRRAYTARRRHSLPSPPPRTTAPRGTPSPAITSSDSTQLTSVEHAIQRDDLEHQIAREERDALTATRTPRAFSARQCRLFYVSGTLQRPAHVSRARLRTCRLLDGISATSSPRRAQHRHEYPTDDGRHKAPTG